MIPVSLAQWIDSAQPGELIAIRQAVDGRIKRECASRKCGECNQCKPVISTGILHRLIVRRAAQLALPLECIECNLKLFRPSGSS